MYGKVFDSMYDGTLRGHWEAIVTMQQLVVLANADGVIDMTPQAIAGRTTIPLAIIEKGLEHLQQPDEYTRTPGEDGRRIVLLDAHRPWGWRLVNHWKYRALRNMEQKREADRDRIKDKRNQNKDVAIPSRMSPMQKHMQEADAEAGTRTKRAAEHQWWKSEEGIKTKGDELGIPARRGESWSEYKSRLFDHLNATVKPA